MSFSEKLSNSYLWEKRKLVEITKKIGSGATPRGGKGAYKERGIPFIRSQNIYNCKFNSDGLVYINDEQAVKLNNVKLEKNDVLINITGDSVARCTKLPNEFIDGRVNQHVAIIRCNEKFIDSDYLKYYLVNKETQMFLLSLAGSGATRAALTKSMLENIEISLPYIEEQKAISKILSDLDEKIEVNNKINKNLEEMAQAIFKQWFVDFEFPNEEGKPYKSSGGEMVESELGMIPKDWKIKKVGDYCSVRSGYAFKSKWWTESGVKVIKIKNIFNNTINFNDISYVDLDKVEKAKEFLVTTGDLVIAMTGATLGKIAIIPYITEKILVNQRVGRFFLGENPIYKLPFLYCLLKEDYIYNQIVNRGFGSAQPNISSNDIQSLNIVYPNKYYLDKFNKINKSIFEKILFNFYENKRLENLRDTLLPKLMSGEIRVPLENNEN